MANRSLQEISSLLTSRLSVAKKNYANPWSMEPDVHRSWDAESKASLVILWGLLVYPRLDPDMKKNRERTISVNRIYQLFGEHLGSEKDWSQVVARLKKHDYIRFPTEETITAGTRLWTAVDASKMYHLFRTSVLVRKMNLSEKEEGL
ncbi:hypothetical protein [Salinithrix halophila]|uniref:Uncharacterized protein n=1 Tax=Salinithrix halophila TaxID=1485204 RepID=A0ABV8JER2_9BACL